MQIETIVCPERIEAKRESKHRVRLARRGRFCLADRAFVSRKRDTLSAKMCMRLSAKRSAADTLGILYLQTEAEDGCHH